MVDAYKYSFDAYRAFDFLVVRWVILLRWHFHEGIRKDSMSGVRALSESLHGQNLALRLLICFFHQLL